MNSDNIWIKLNKIFQSDKERFWTIWERQGKALSWMEDQELQEALDSFDGLDIEYEEIK